MNPLVMALMAAAKHRQGGYLLDSYPGASAAYALQYLKTSFVGSDVFTVRRSSDDAESGFTPTEITDGTLVTWVGAGNDGFVKTLFDHSGNSKDVTNTATLSQPKIVSAGVLQDLDFDGNDDHLASGTGALGSTTDLTVTAWVKTPASFEFTSPNAGQCAVSRYDYGSSQRVWATGLYNKDTVDNNADRFAVLFGDPSDGSFECFVYWDNILSTNTWYHFAFTFNAGTLKLFVDGDEKTGTIKTGSVPASLYSTTVPLRIGAIAQNSASQQVFEGCIDSVVEWPSVLSPANILDIYNLGR